eukprot:scaffold121830_cov18-Prasinocladus_malaysianus.AAC.1
MKSSVKGSKTYIDSRDISLRPSGSTELGTHSSATLPHHKNSLIGVLCNVRFSGSLAKRTRVFARKGTTFILELSGTYLHHVQLALERNV